MLRGRTERGDSAGEVPTTFPYRALVIGAAVLAVACVAAAAVMIASAADIVRPSTPAADGPAAMYVEDRHRDQPLPVWYEVDGDVLSLRIDEGLIESARVDNYPAFGPEGTRVPETLSEATAVLPLVEGRTFTAAQTIESWNKGQEGMAGGYDASVSFFDGNGDLVGCVSYNPAFPGDGVAVIADGTIYCMDGDQRAVIDYLNDLVERLSGLECFKNDEGMAS